MGAMRSRGPTCTVALVRLATPPRRLGKRAWLSGSPPAGLLDMISTRWQSQPRQSPRRAAQMATRQGAPEDAGARPISAVKGMKRWGAMQPNSRVMRRKPWCLSAPQAATSAKVHRKSRQWQSTEPTICPHLRPTVRTRLIRPPLRHTTPHRPTSQRPLRPGGAVAAARQRLANRPAEAVRREPAAAGRLLLRRHRSCPPQLTRPHRRKSLPCHRMGLSLPARPVHAAGRASPPRLQPSDACLQQPISDRRART